jgi:tRNA dimethylallyltransferase
VGGGRAIPYHPSVPARLVIAIFGPTASGKSAVAEALARRMDGVVVSADAMQVYAGLPILTNQSLFPARLVGIWPLSTEGSVGLYAPLAHQAIDETIDAGRVPIVVGGTGLYLRAALTDLDVPPPAHPGTRARLELLYDRVGPERAHELLAQRDPSAAERIHPNDRRRVVRALELVESGRSLTPSEDRLWATKTRHPTALIGLDLSRDELVLRIEERTRTMFERGVQGEVARACTDDLSPTARRIIGLREVCELPPAQATAAIVRRTLQYAAYQRKWLRRLPTDMILDAGLPPDVLARQILAWVSEAGRTGNDRAGE